MQWSRRVRIKMSFKVFPDAQEHERDWTYEKNSHDLEDQHHLSPSLSCSSSIISSEISSSDWMLPDLSNAPELKIHHVHLHHHHLNSDQQKNETNSSTDDDTQALLEALGLEEDGHGNLVSNAASYLEDDEDFEVSRFIENYCCGPVSSACPNYNNNNSNNHSTIFENNPINNNTMQTTIFDNQQLISKKYGLFNVMDSVTTDGDCTASEKPNQIQKTLSPSKERNYISDILEDSSLNMTMEALNQSADFQLKQIDSMIQNILQKYQTPQKQSQKLSSTSVYRKHDFPTSSNNPQNGQQATNHPPPSKSSPSSKPVKSSSRTSSINLLAQYNSPKAKTSSKTKANYSPAKEPSLTAQYQAISPKTAVKNSPKGTSHSKNSTAVLSNENTEHSENTKSSHEISKTSSSSFKEKEGETFFERAVNWKANVEKANKQKQKELNRSIKQECSFKPEINPISIQKRHEDNMDVHDRLYIDSFRASDKNDEIRYKLTEEEFRKTCTFKPKLLNNFSISSKYRDISPKKAPPTKELPLDEECTFKPQTNDSICFNRSCMDYLSEDAFSRLSKRKTPNISRSDPHIVENEKFDMLFMSRPKSAGKFTRPSSNFHEFLKRQQDLIEDRERKVDFIKMTEHPFKPSINEKSVAIVNRTEFEKRCEFYQQRRELTVSHCLLDSVIEYLIS